MPSQHIQNKCFSRGMFFVNKSLESMPPKIQNMKNKSIPFCVLFYFKCSWHALERFVDKKHVPRETLILYGLWESISIFFSQLHKKRGKTKQNTQSFSPTSAMKTKAVQIELIFRPEPVSSVQISLLCTKVKAERNKRRMRTNRSRFFDFDSPPLLSEQESKNALLYCRKATFKTPSLMHIAYNASLLTIIIIAVYWLLCEILLLYGERGVREIQVV